MIQYNTNNRIGPLTAKIFPYPFTISRDRVTDEHAPVKFAIPNHPVLTFPNEISEMISMDGYRKEEFILLQKLIQHIKRSLR